MAGWQGSLNWKIGLFPSNAVEMLEDEEVSQVPEDKSVSTNSNGGTHETIHGAMQQHGDDKSTIYREEYCLSPSRHKFVSLFWREKLELIAVSLSEFNVQISRENDLEDVICATGSEEGLNLLMKDLQKLGEQILCHTTTMEDPRIVNFFTKEDNCKTIDTIERSNQCVLGFCEELNVLQVKRSNRCQKGGERFCLGHMEILNSARLSDDVALFLVNGDASHAVVDIIVHETTEMRKCYTLPTQYIPGGKILAGDVMVMAPGHCFCKFVIHASCSISIYGTRGEAQCLFQTVTKCLETADRYNCTSIAIPAFGIRSSYPVAECTRMVVEAVKTYVKSRNQGKIKEIYLCADKPDIIQHFSTSIQNIFLQVKSALPFTRQRSNDVMIRAPSTQINRQTISVTIREGDIAKQEEFQTGNIKYGMQIAGRSLSLSRVRDGLALRSFSSQARSTSGKGKSGASSISNLITTTTKSSLQEVITLHVFAEDIASATKMLDCANELALSLSKERMGTHETIHGAMQQHGDDESTIYREEYCLSPSRHKFVSLFWWEKLELIAVSLSEFNVQISRENDLEDVICATGSEEGLNLFMKELKKLGEQVLCHITTEKDPRIVRFLAKEDICKTIDPIERSNQCVLGFCEEPNVLQVKRSNRCQKGGERFCLGHMEILNSAWLSDDVALFLVNGDARHAVVDIIVHETAEMRKDFTLPTQYIPGGKILAEDVTVMTPRHCVCKYVIHASSNIYMDGTRGEEQSLFQTVTKCLETADRYNCTSIAIPAFGICSSYPVAECTRMVVEAVKTYVKSRNQGKIKEIYLCADKPDIIQHFSTSIQNIFPQAKSALPFTRPRYFIPLTRMTDYFECKIDGMRLCVKQGDITEEAVDAIVNSTNDAFDLNLGSVSRTLKSKCGEDLVVDCAKRVTEMQAKGVCVTRAFNMNCRYILHVSSNKFHTDWQAGIKAILKEAEGLGINTIAFPALGTGGYNATSEMLAEAMFRALVRFYKSHTDTELEVRVVLLDSEMIPPFVSQIQAQVARAKVKTTKLWKRTLFKGKCDVSSLSNLITTTTNNSLQEVITLHAFAEDSASVTKMLDSTRAKALSFAEERMAVSEMKSILPKFWVGQGPDEKLKICSLSTSDEEFKIVENNFRASLGLVNINIVNIERVQNPTLYMHYMIKKKEKESQNADIPGITNEKTLWHGTDGTAISNINHHGFNRSYCGKNATAYGEGVYFAVSSEYSASPKYSPPDSKGRRYIYQCKVLTGQAMIGKAGLKVLPQRSGDILYDSATNNLKQPTMYVIFNDYQAYPEYLITFTN